MGSEPSEWLACPSCGDAAMVRDPRVWCCTACGRRFGDLGGLACLLVDRDEHEARWRTQVAAFDAMVRRVGERTQTDLARFDLLPRTRRRLERFAAASAHNRDRVLALFAAAGVKPTATGSIDEAAVQDEIRGARGRLPLTHYYELLMRDWAWDRDGNRENEEALARVLAVAGPELTWGRTLVLGAGAGRLAYDLRDRTTVTVAVDFDPLLSLAAHEVVFGEGLSLYELPLSPDDSGEVAVSRALRRPGAVPEHLHWIVADARRPPFAAQSFDTVVTPWFIDVVDLGLREVIGAVHRVLKAGGRWVSTGPLLYPETRALGERFAPDEVQALVELGGFAIDAHRIEEVRYLRSPASGHARLESVLSFAATKQPGFATTTAELGGIPAWVVLPHRPVVLPARALGGDPGHPLLRRAQQLADGERSLAAIAEAMRADALLPADLDARDAAAALLVKLAQG